MGLHEQEYYKRYTHALGKANTKAISPAPVCTLKRHIRYVHEASAIPGTPPGRPAPTPLLALSPRLRQAHVERSFARLSVASIAPPTTKTSPSCFQVASPRGTPRDRRCTFPTPQGALRETSSAGPPVRERSKRRGGSNNNNKKSGVANKRRTGVAADIYIIGLAKQNQLIQTLPLQWKFQLRPPRKPNATLF